MTTSTLHLNNPVPSNGAVVSSLGGRHTVTVTLAGVGAISCVVQAWGSEQGTDSRKIGAPVTVSGTTTVSQTLTFDADCKQFWLELVKLSPACKFNATVENDGSTSLAGPVVAPVVGYRTLSSFWDNRWDPTFQVAPNILTNQYINGSGVIGASTGLNVSAPIPVTPGEVIAWWNDQQENLADKGGFYNLAGVFLSSLGANRLPLSSGHQMLFRVPDGAVTARLNFRLTTHKYWFGYRRATPRPNLFEKLTFSGDSLFAGSGTYSDKTVPQRVGELFQVPVENTAVGGRRISGSTATALWQQIKANDHLASAGVFMAGYNDWDNSVALGAVNSAIDTEFNGALNILLSYLANGRPWQKWYIVTPPPSTTASPNGIGLTLRDYCQAIIDACLRYGFTCIDLNKDWGVDYRRPSMYYLYSPDGIHENWLSTDIMAGFLYGKIANGA